jgi:hypothetical protein
LSNELHYLQNAYEKELSTIIERYAMNAATIEDKETRIHQLEERIQELTEKSASREQENHELNIVIEDLKNRLTKASCGPGPINTPIIPVNFFIF